jgi:transcriptional regulator with XRE-family HTH domain
MVAMSPSRTAKAKESKDADLVAIGRRLRELRLEHGMTQEALADAAGLHWTYIGQIERAERNFTVKNVLRLERGLGIGPGDLLRTALDGVSQPSTG